MSVRDKKYLITVFIKSEPKALSTCYLLFSYFKKLKRYWYNLNYCHCMLNMIFEQFLLCYQSRTDIFLSLTDFFVWWDSKEVRLWNKVGINGDLKNGKNVSGTGKGLPSIFLPPISLFPSPSSLISPTLHCFFFLPLSFCFHFITFSFQPIPLHICPHFSCPP